LADAAPTANMLNNSNCVIARLKMEEKPRLFMRPIYSPEDQHFYISANPDFYVLLPCDSKSDSDVHETMAKLNRKVQVFQ